MKSGKDSRATVEAAKAFKQACDKLRLNFMQKAMNELPTFLAETAFGSTSFKTWNTHDFGTIKQSRDRSLQNRKLVSGSANGFLVDGVRNISRFDGFRSALFEVFKTRLTRGATLCKQRWDSELGLLIVSVSITDVSLSGAAIRLGSAILLQELDLSCPSKTEILQIRHLKDILKENCAEERKSLTLALEALDRAKAQVKILQSNRK